MSTPTEASVIRGQAWAYAAAILGGTISIVANVAHSFIAPPGAPGDWKPEPGAIVSSAVWPVLLFFAVEVLARVKWFPGFWWGVLRVGGLLSVAAGAFIVSWQHMYSLLRHYGEGPTVAFLGPVAVDGLMVMATAALLVIGIRKNRAISDESLVTEPVSAHLPHQPVTLKSGQVNDTIPDHLISTARFAVANYANTTGELITADELAARMNINVALATRVLDKIDDTPSPVLNGASANAGGDGR